MEVVFNSSIVFEKNYNAYYNPLKKIILNQGGSRCFCADQKVMTSEGSKKISDIKTNDLVLSYDFEADKNIYKKVNNVFVSKNTKPAYKITLANGEQIIATEDHNFYSEGGFYSLKHLLSLWKKMETWKAIPNFSRYEASNLGNLRSLNYKNSGKIKLIKPAISKDGYYQTMLQSDTKKYFSWKVHKFIAVTFLGEKIKDMEINHIDGNKLNNNIANLEWVTRSENILHSYKLGLQKPMRGSLNGNSKLSESDIKEIRDYRKSCKGRYYNRKMLAEKYGVTASTIKDIVNKRRGLWSHI